MSTQDKLRNEEDDKMDELLEKWNDKYGDW